MRIVANGAQREVADAVSVRDLVVSFGLTPETVVVEHNGEALARVRYADTRLRDGDRIEIVRAVAGG